MTERRPHKHLIIDASILKAPKNEKKMKSLLKIIIEAIGMKLAKLSDKQPNPIAWYCEDKGNEGMTAFGILTTSHIALHVWDRCEPNQLHFDLYSCSDFEVNEILAILDHQFGLIKSKVTVLDREGDAFERFTA